MASTRPGATQDEILKALTEQAVALWGKDKADSLASSLSDTAKQLRNTSRVLPRPDVEPGYYQ